MHRPLAPHIAATLALAVGVGLCAWLATPALPARGADQQPQPTATATADPSPGLCRVVGRQTAATGPAERGRPVELAISLWANCPEDARGRADIMLVIDHSGSMADKGKFEAAGEAVRQFVAGVDFERHRAGLVLFNERPWVAQPLTDRADRLLGAFDASGQPTGALAIGAGEEEFARRGRLEAVPIVVLMTDGQSSEANMLAAARTSRESGTVIFAVGLGADAAHAALQRVATSPDHYYYAPGPEMLAEVYERIAAKIRDFSATNVTLFDRLSPDVGYVPDSGRPDEPRVRETLQWRRAFLLEQAAVLTYSVRPSRTGRVQPSAELWVEFTDADGLLRRVDLERVELEVVEPVVHTVHLPVAQRHACWPIEAWADVVLAIDVSSSMAGEKVAAAASAARAFVGLLGSGDRAAVVAYDREARVVQPLTGDISALLRALENLSVGEGTRLDRGIEVSVAELTGAGARVGGRRAIVLLSDGRQEEEPARARAWAEYAWGYSIAVFTIAFGEDAEVGFLRELADSPAHAYTAGTAEQLGEIYRALAGAVRCR
jgi:Mg-chelatase subunit ChlD